MYGFKRLVGKKSSIRGSRLKNPRRNRGGKNSWGSIPKSPPETVGDNQVQSFARDQVLDTSLEIEKAVPSSRWEKLMGLEKS